MADLDTFVNLAVQEMDQANTQSEPQVAAYFVARAHVWATLAVAYSEQRGN